MKAKIVYMALALALAFSLAAVAITPAGPVLAATTWYVDDNTCPDTGDGSEGNPFCTIQDAVNAAAPSGDTITVAAGIYTENVDITKSITLQGAGAASCTVTAATSGDYVFDVSGASNVEISGFTITGASGFEIYGIQMYNAHYWLIRDNTITQNENGIVAAFCQYNTIRDNQINNNGFGIDLRGCKGNTIQDNDITNNGWVGIWLVDSGYAGWENDDNEIIGNTIEDNGVTGIEMYGGANNLIQNNEIRNNGGPEPGSGVFLGGGETKPAADGNRVLDNRIQGNSQDGVTLHSYCVNTLIQGNDILSNVRGGIYQSWLADVTHDNVAHLNNIVGNHYGVENNYPAVIDATNNWWGCAAGPGETGCDTVSDNVNYDPWLGEAYAPTKSTGTATGIGTASFSPDTGALEDLTSVAEGVLPSEGKPALVFPHGFFSFTITGLNPLASPGDTVIVTITLPQNVPVGTQYWKWGPTVATPAGEWYQILMGSDDGDNVITITLQDGGVGDDDLTVNGVIVDQGGPGSPPAPEPTPTPTPPPEEEVGCFIATAAYGTSTAAEIDVLRAFRDGVLLRSSLGSQLVALYYDVSPPVADFISENSFLKTLVRELVIDPMVSVATFTQAIWGK